MMSHCNQKRKAPQNLNHLKMEVILVKGYRRNKNLNLKNRHQVKNNNLDGDLEEDWVVDLVVLVVG